MYKSICFLLVLSFFVEFSFAQKNTPIVVASYNLRYNTANDGVNAWPNRKEDVKVRVRVTSSDRKGGKLKYETGAKEQEGSLYSMDLPAGLTQAELKEYGDAWYNRLSFNGFSGTITGFGTPPTHAGDTLQIIDSEEPDREGKYLIDSVKITYDPFSEGFQRENTLSFKV